MYMLNEGTTTMVRRNWTQIAAAEFRNMQHAYKKTEKAYRDDWADLYRRTTRKR